MSNSNSADQDFSAAVVTLSIIVVKHPKRDQPVEEVDTTVTL
jgi:hypothetical protein